MNQRRDRGKCDPDQMIVRGSGVRKTRRRTTAPHRWNRAIMITSKFSETFEDADALAGGKKISGIVKATEAVASLKDFPAFD